MANQTKPFLGSGAFRDEVHNRRAAGNFSIPDVTLTAPQKTQTTPEKKDSTSTKNDTGKNQKQQPTIANGALKAEIAVRRASGDFTMPGSHESRLKELETREDDIRRQFLTKFGDKQFQPLDYTRDPVKNQEARAMLSQLWAAQNATKKQRDIVVSDLKGQLAESVRKVEDAQLAYNSRGKYTGSAIKSQYLDNINSAKKQEEAIRKKIAKITGSDEPVDLSGSIGFSNDTWDRWVRLAQKTEPLTESEMEEAKSAISQLKGSIPERLSTLFMTEEERELYTKRWDLANILESKTNPSAAFIKGVIDIFSFGLHDDYVSNLTKENPEMFGYMNPDYRYDSDHPIAYDMGNVVGDQLLTYGFGKAAGAVVKSVPDFFKMPKPVKNAIGSGLALGSKNALDAAASGKSADDIAKSAGIAFAGGTLGSGVEQVASKALTSVLLKKGLQNSASAAVFKDVFSSISSSGTEIATRAALDPEYNPSAEEIAKDIAIDAMFSAIGSIFDTTAATKSAKVQLDQEIDQMKRDYIRIIDQDAGADTITVLDDIAMKNRHIRETLKKNQYVGQQKTVDDILEFLDELDDAIDTVKRSYNSDSGSDRPVDLPLPEMGKQQNNAAASQPVDLPVPSNISRRGVNENGLAPLPQEEISALSNGKRNKIISTFQEAKTFARNALSNSQNEDCAYLGKLPEDVMQHIQKNLGSNVQADGVMINGNNIRHMMNQYGDRDAVKKQGGTPITADDIATISQILAYPDEISISTTRGGTGQTLTFRKQIGDFYFTTQGVINKNQFLQIDTLYKKRISTEYASAQKGVVDLPVAP